ncbi:MAG: response regulator transcription factor [Hyphomicrobiales bacterium]|nr:response regulator transcription factor [Hyphomicrobiales bacterium]
MTLSSSPSRIVIGDDHPLVLSALCAAFQEVWHDLDIVQCATLDEVIAGMELHEHTVDLVLLDLHMPGSQGLSGLIRLAKSYPTTPVILISAQTDTDTVQRAMACGASAYLSKSMKLEEMIDAISKVLEGEIWSLSTPDASTDFREDYAKRLASLSPQQLRILQLIVQGRLNKQIAGELGIAEQTVKIHASTIFRKLGVRTRTQAAVAVGAFFKSQF